LSDGITTTRDADDVIMVSSSGDEPRLSMDVYVTDTGLPDDL